MVRVRTLDCVSCGGPLEVPPGRDVAVCSYCGRTLAIEHDRTHLSDSDSQPGRTLADELLRGYARPDTGSGRRYSVEEMKSRDWPCYERGVWPIAAKSSSRFGASWSHDVTIGAPRVYPRHGDRPGAWAPRKRTSHTEWLEVMYPPDAPPVTAIRVFETCAAGSTFAVTVRSAEGPGEERLVWKQRPTPAMTGAQVLEIALPAPEKLASVRVYVTNDHKTWAEIDTIGLVAVEPVPMHLRRRPAPLPRVSAGAALAIAVTLAILVGGGLFLYRLATSVSGEPAPPPVAPSRAMAGATMAPWDVDRSGLASAGVVWADRGVAASTEYGAERWSRHQAAGAPDVFPSHGDHDQAWATKKQDAGPEWLSVAFAGPVDATAVVVVETFNPGALVRVDDVSEPGAPVTLWRGTTAAASRSRVLRLSLPEPRPIRGLRLVLDTGRVSGWNELDAVGLVPASAR